MKQAQSNDSVALQSLAIASVGKNANQVDGMALHGIYQVECISPIESMRARYVELRDEIASLKNKSWFLRLIFRRLLASMLREFTAIPLTSKWVEPAPNLVVTVGKNHALDTELAGSAYTAAWYFGLIGATGYGAGVVAADTMPSHAGWAEDQTYTEATRPAPSWAAASAGAKATSAVVAFSINGTTTILGIFMANSSTKGEATSTLFSGGLFTGGNKALTNGDTLNVTYSLAG